MRACREVSPFLFSSDILRTEYGEHHDDDEYREDDSHFTNMTHRINPYLIEKSITRHDFHEGPATEEAIRAVVEGIGYTFKGRSSESR